MKKISFIVAGMVSMGTAVASPWPVGIADEATAIQREPTTISVIDNDIGDNLYISSVNAWSRNAGRIVINDDKKSVTYTSGDATSDEFWYVLKDDQGRSNAAKVTVSISTGDSPVGGWPSAAGDSAEATYGEAITIPVLDNDSGTDLKLVSVNEWSTNKGKVSISSDNEVTYRQYGEPRGDQIDTFWYVFEDKWGRRNAAKVVISLTDTPTTAWPTAVSDSAIAKNGLKAHIPVLENDIGEGLFLTKTNDWTENGGRTVIRGDVIRYTPPNNFTGTDAFWYDFEDKFGRSNSAKVEVVVSQNDQLSVVNFCNATYQTDGTYEGTELTELSVIAPEPEFYVDGSSSWRLQGEGVFGDRRYSVEVSESGEQSIWVEEDEQKTLLAEADSSTNLKLLGVYNESVYFVNGLNLYAHTGGKVVELGDIYAGTYDSSNENHRDGVTVMVNSGVLYFIAQLADISQDGSATGHRNYWRVSDGLDIHPVKIEYLQTYSSGDYTDDYQTIRYIDRRYFNGYDYTFQRLLDYPDDYEGPRSRIVRQDHGEIIDVISASGSTVTRNIYENNGRLFLITSAFRPLSVDPALWRPSILYMIDNKDDSFVKLKSCPLD